VAAVLLSLLLTLPLAAQSVSAPITTASPEQLRQWLRQYPAADANRDGVLTLEEAERYRQQLVREQAAAKRSVAPEFRHEYTSATMSDGVQIALAVGYPRGFDPADAARKWPAIFHTSGYPNATVPTDPAQYGQRCVTVNASIRGSGASGGALSPWTARTWQDGYEVIEHWIVRQPWSNGKAGIHGFSWPGLVGFLTATTQPPSLKAVCVGGLIDDFYRGICYMGGVRNCGFPIDWLNSFYHPDGPFGSGAAARHARGLDEAAYRAIVTGRPPCDLMRDSLWLSLHEPLDGPLWRENSLGTYAARIRAPILISHAWQDEQTGPTGWQLWKRVPNDVPKRLAVGHGNHGTCPGPTGGAGAWFGHWLFDTPDALTADSSRRVECYFESRGSVNGRRIARHTPLFASDFPLPQTRWTRYYLRTGRQLSATAPEAGERGDQYHVQHGAPTGDEQQVRYLLEFSEPTAICGPAVLTLWATLTTVDTDFAVLVADQGPDGRLFGLQRGLLRASHRALDRERSDHVESAGQRLLIRPQHLHTRVEPVTPYEPVEYQIEIFAFGHVFRPGHKLALVITRPPADDPIGATRSGAPSYRYDSQPPPGTVTILHDAEHPSSVLLPVLPELPPLPAEPVPPAEQVGLQPLR
jgi:predicted acyl esterase